MESLGHNEFTLLLIRSVIQVECFVTFLKSLSSFFLIDTYTNPWIIAFVVHIIHFSFSFKLSSMIHNTESIALSSIQQSIYGFVFMFHNTILSINAHASTYQITLDVNTKIGRTEFNACTRKWNGPWLIQKLTCLFSLKPFTKSMISTYRQLNKV